MHGERPVHGGLSVHKVKVYDCVALQLVFSTENKVPAFYDLEYLVSRS